MLTQKVKLHIVILIFYYIKCAKLHWNLKNVNMMFNYKKQRNKYYLNYKHKNLVEMCVNSLKLNIGCPKKYHYGGGGEGVIYHRHIKQILKYTQAR